jgi:hypothetical protein
MFLHIKTLCNGGRCRAPDRSLRKPVRQSTPYAITRREKNYKSAKHFAMAEGAECRIKAHIGLSGNQDLTPQLATAKLRYNIQIA